MPDLLGEVVAQDPNHVPISYQIAEVEAVTEFASKDGVRVLEVSSNVASAYQLVDCAQDDVILGLYDDSDDTPDMILLSIEAALDDQLATSIAFAIRGLGEAQSHLTAGYSVSLHSFGRQRASELLGGRRRLSDRRWSC